MSSLTNLPQKQLKLNVINKQNPGLKISLIAGGNPTS